MQIQEHDTVALLEDVSAESLHRGDVGAVVHVYANGATFEVEFLDVRRKTKCVATVPTSKLMRLNVLSLSA